MKMLNDNFALFKINVMTYNDIWRRLATKYGEREAKAITRFLLEDLYGMSFTDVLCGAVENITHNELKNLEKDILRLEQMEPVQYVTGRASFFGNMFHVEPGVLIPRPETEQLCDEIIKRISCEDAPYILDIGTGSGCISITLALNVPNANVYAWDISDKALRIAKENANALSATVKFVKQDALSIPPETGKWNAIVSNPPYICKKEIATMERNVLDYEPSLALFVPDDDPLLFYRSIAKYAWSALKRNGWLFFEINPIYARDTEKMLESLGFTDITTITDIYGKERNTICRKR